MLVRVRGGCGAGGHAQLGETVRHVSIHGLFCNDLALADSQFLIYQTRILGAASRRLRVTTLTLLVRRTPLEIRSFKSDTPGAPAEVGRVDLTALAACTPFGWV